MSSPPITRLEVSVEEAGRIRAAVRRADVRLLGPDYVIAGPEHVASLTELLSDPVVSDPLYDLPRPFTCENVAAWIAAACERQEQGTAVMAVAVDAAGRVLTFSLFTVWPELSAAEIAGAYRSDMQSQGIGKRGAAHSFEWMFEHLGVRLIGLTAALDNARSAAVIEAAGFIPMGERDCIRPDGTIRRSRYWEMLRDDWRERER